MTYQDRRAAKMYAEQLKEPHRVEHHRDTMCIGEEMICGLCKAWIKKTKTKDGFTKIIVRIIKSGDGS